MNCQNCVPFCKIFCKTCDYIGKEENCPNHSVTCGGKNIPTFFQYREILKVKLPEKQKIFNFIEKDYVKNTLFNYNRFMQVMEFTDDDCVSEINNKTINEFAKRLNQGTYPESATAKGQEIQRQYSLPTIKCFISSLRSAFSRWIKEEISEEWFVPNIEMPIFLRGAEYPKYQEKSQDLKTKVAIWYRSLYNRGLGTRKNKDRMFVMFMYKYAMRNGDVLRLKYSNFQFANGKCRLVYVPHKTSRSSGSTVKVYLTQIDQHDLLAYKAAHKHKDDDFIFDDTIQHSMISRLNRELRKLGFVGSKGLYELRKLCIDAVLKKYGILYACAISGDNYNTIQHFYSDARSIEFCSLNDDEYLRTSSQQNQFN